MLIELVQCVYRSMAIISKLVQRRICRTFRHMRHLSNRVSGLLHVLVGGANNE